MLAPFTLQNILLAIRAFLCRLSCLLDFLGLDFISSFTHIILNDFHFWVKSRTFWKVIGTDRKISCIEILLSFSFVISSVILCCLHTHLVRIWHVLELFIFLHVLLYCFRHQGWLFGRMLTESLPIALKKSILSSCFGHFLVIIEFDLLDDHEVKPIYLICHLTVF